MTIEKMNDLNFHDSTNKYTMVKIQWNYNFCLKRTTLEFVAKLVVTYDGVFD